MSAIKSIVAVLLILAAVPVMAAPTPGLLPKQPVPKGLVAGDESTGGRILHGPLAGASSGSTAFITGLHQMNKYFGNSLKLFGAVRSKDESVTLAAFGATLRGVPVSGLVVTAYAPNGASRFAGLFDDPRRLKKSLPTMLARLKGITQETMDRVKPLGGGPTTDLARYEEASQSVKLIRRSFPDGTAAIGIAPGFTPQVMNGGAFYAGSADGAYIKLYSPVSLLDPSGSIYQVEKNMARNSGGGMPPGQIFISYDTDPVSAWKKFLTENARQNNFDDPSPQVLHSEVVQNLAGGWTGKLASGTITFQGKPFVFIGSLLVGPRPSPEGGWTLQITMLDAPAERAATDMPALIAMQRSEKVDTNAVRQQTMRNIATIVAQTTQWLAANKAAGDAQRDAVFQRSMANAQAAQDAMDRTAHAFIGYINETSVVQNSQTGAYSTVSSSLATSLANSNPGTYSIVPVSQYQPGVTF